MSQAYTVFKSKWQIVNLCSSITTSPKAFKFSVNVSNNWPFYHAKTQILWLNRLGSLKHWKAINFMEKKTICPSYTWKNLFSFNAFFLIKQAWTLGLVLNEELQIMNISSAWKFHYFIVFMKIWMIFKWLTVWILAMIAKNQW